MLFDFECPKCGKVFEGVAKQGSKAHPVCPDCGEKSNWKPSWSGGFRFTFRDGFNPCTGEYHPNKAHYEECKRRKGLVKVE